MALAGGARNGPCSSQDEGGSLAGKKEARTSRNTWSILFLNLPHSDLVHVRWLRQEMKQGEPTGLLACVLVAALSGLGSNAGTRNQKRSSKERLVGFSIA